jgi:hypothetical protein
MNPNKEATPQDRDALSKYHNEVRQKARNIHDELGISKEELMRRKAEAEKPYVVKPENSDKSFKIMSFSRAKQIMQGDSVKLQHNKQLRDMEIKTKTLKRIRNGVIFIASIAILYISLDLLYPRWKIRHDRNMMLQRRYNEIFLPSMQKYLAEQERLRAIEEGRAPAEELKLEEVERIIGPALPPK